jgi:hypothetical protein
MYTFSLSQQYLSSMLKLIIIIIIIIIIARSKPLHICYHGSLNPPPLNPTGTL